MCKERYRIKRMKHRHQEYYIDDCIWGPLTNIYGNIYSTTNKAKLRKLCKELNKGERSEVWNEQM